MFRFASGVFLMIGAMIGGGILAIPIVSANFGFLATFLLIIASWLVMTKTGLNVLNLSISCVEKNNTYYSIVGKFLGKKAQKLTVFLFLWILYLSLSSYISGCVSLIMSYKLPASVFFNHLNISILYTLIFGSLVVISSNLIVKANTILVTLKLLSIMLVVYITTPYYTNFNFNGYSGTHNGFTTLVLVTINAFGFHFIIPSLVNYYGKNNANQLKVMLITATTTVCFLYCTWLLIIYALIPANGDYGLSSIYNSKNQLLAFNQSLTFLIHSTSILSILSFFQVVSMFGSFFCVGLAIFDFLTDMFNSKSRIKICCITFMPALLISLLSENMYVHAMSMAGYISIVLEIIIPTWAVVKLHLHTPKSQIIMSS